MPYLGRSSQKAIRQRFIFTQSSAGATSISGADDSNATLRFDDGEYVDVILNGITLAKTEYNTTTANTIGGLAALSIGDVLQVTVYDMFNVADSVRASTGGTFNGGVTINGDLTVTGSGAGAAGIVSASTSGTAINIDSSNRVTMPNQPAFLARRNDTTTTVPSGGIMQFDSVSIYGGFDTASGYTYTFPVAGLYRIHVSCILGGQSYSNAQLKIQVNNADFEQRHFSSTSSDYYTHSVDTLVNASVNDTTRIKCTDGAYFYGNQWSVFMGHLIG